MVEAEKQAFVDKMYRERGYILDFHKVMAAEDFDFLKAYDQLIQAGYTKQRTLDAKTKEIIYAVILTSVKASVDHIKSHIKLALDYGATKKEVLEALEICIPAASVPAFMIGFEAWKQVVSPQRVEPSQP
ncbi:MAG: carboxymuconolactone decarboxylase family protein [Dehalococcoidia bacterium]|nr:carboxymuconolactone decarboxylase family protein [Dehalococcoidia bacterium]